MQHVWGEERLYWVLVGKPEVKRSLERTRHRREDYIKLDLKELGSGARTVSRWFRTGTGGGQL
jgi:hypothetical protein